MVERIRWDFIGLSTDTKPTPSDSPKVTDGSNFYEVDTSKLYIWAKNDWYEKTVQGGGGTDTWGKVTYLVDSEPVTVEIQSKEEYDSLGGDPTVTNPITINGETVDKYNIVGVEFGTLADYTPENFLMSNTHQDLAFTGTENLVTIGDYFLRTARINTEINLPNVESIGDCFMYSCQRINSKISIPKVKTIDDLFMYNCTRFNAELTLPNTLTTIGSHFMETCSAYEQNMNIPSSITSIGGYFMYQCNKFTGSLACESKTGISTESHVLATNNSTAAIYTTGITLTGTYAAEWKTTFPDHDSTPYRKLIIGD